MAIEPGDRIDRCARVGNFPFSMLKDEDSNLVTDTEPPIDFINGLPLKGSIPLAENAEEYRQLMEDSDHGLHQCIPTIFAKKHEPLSVYLGWQNHISVQFGRGIYLVSAGLGIAAGFRDRWSWGWVQDPPDIVNFESSGSFAFDMVAGSTMRYVPHVGGIWYTNRSFQASGIVNYSVENMANLNKYIITADLTLTYANDAGAITLTTNSRSLFPGSGIGISISNLSEVTWIGDREPSGGTLLKSVAFDISLKVGSGRP